MRLRGTHGLPATPRREYLLSRFRIRVALGDEEPLQRACLCGVQRRREYGSVWCVLFYLEASFKLTMALPDHALASGASRDAQILNFLLILTTTHAQDFRDVVGDRATGRLTIPLAYPRVSRLSMLVLLPVWSYFLCNFWDVSVPVSVTLQAYATYIGLRFYLSSASSGEDSAAYRAYNVRLQISWGSASC